MPLILPGNVASATASTGYTVANSCRFNDGDSADLSLTLGSSLGTRSLYTFSCWIKRGVLGTTQNLFDGTDGTYPTTFSISSADKLVFYDTGENATFTSDAVLRDSAAWYHLVCRVDTSQASNENRVKFYINGVQATTTQTNTLTQDGNISWGKEVAHYVGGRANYFDGYMAEVVWITASSLAPTSFGEFDEDSPTIWKPIDVSELTFGTHGFYLDFEASDNLGNDANGGTDWTETNLAATDQASDSPTNNFATFNPLVSITDAPTFSEGNCKIAIGSAGQFGACSTVGLTAGKWYAEFVKSVTSDNDMCVGITSDLDDARSDNHAGVISNSYSYRETGTSITGNSESSYGDSYDTDDVIGVALNLDDNELTFYKDNVVQNSGTALSITAVASTVTGAYFLTASCSSSAQSGTWDANFGGCSAFTLASAANDENGYGNFEFAPPAGFLAICSKNLGSDGG